MGKKMTNIKIGTPSWPIIITTYIAVIVCVAVGLSLHFGGAQHSARIIQTSKEQRDIIFTNTINGTMMYVPVTENEGIAEATGTNGSKGYYLFTLLGDTVTISDDIMISQQQNLYDMMLSMLETGFTIKNSNDYYITKIKGTEKIMTLMTEKWGLTSGQTMGALNNYGADKTDDVQLELIVKEDETGDFEFAINIYVEDKAYAIYNGHTLENAAYKALPQELYDYRKLEGLKTSDERTTDYLNAMTAYFKEVAILINTEGENSDEHSEDTK